MTIASTTGEREPHGGGRVLVLFAHPAFERSRVNIVLADAIRHLDGVTLHDLYEAYPDLHIDVAREQALLVQHDVVIFQHPLFWYSTPAILKEWQDLVLEHGWAYGQEGTALRGKRYMSALTTGGRESAYTEGGYNRYTLRHLLSPIEQTARLCGLVVLPPFVVHGTHAITPQGTSAAAADYKRVVTALRDGRIDPTRVENLERINADVDQVLG